MNRTSVFSRMRFLRNRPVKAVTGAFLLFVCLLFVLFPLILMTAASFMPEDELVRRYLAVLDLGKEPVRPALIPDFPSLKPYADLLLRSPGFFVMFWNSCLQVFSVLAGQLLIGMPAAWAFARYEFRFKKLIFLLYLILLVMPFQVMMVPSYLVLDRFGILDTHLAVILPGIFSTFPVYIMEKFFESIPKSFLEAARIDGGGEWTVFFRIGVPMGFPGIMTAILLDFFEYWNALEQPLTFLKNRQLWPLSLYLPNVTADKASLAFAAGLVTMAPPVLLYLNGQTFLEEGIASSGIKE